MKKKTTSTAPLWVSDVYEPEGTDRPSFNRPISVPAAREHEAEQGTIAEIVARANNADRE